jgi:hypothetical protein
MHLDVMTTNGAGSTQFSDDELEAWLEEPALATLDDGSGAACPMQDVISHSPWIWQTSPADMHPPEAPWTDYGESPGSVSPTSGTPSVFQVLPSEAPTPGLRKALSLPVPRKTRATAAERRR